MEKHFPYWDKDEAEIARIMSECGFKEAAHAVRRGQCQINWPDRALEQWRVFAANRKEITR